MKKIILTLFTAISFLSLGQTWSDNVAEIFYNKCAKCHHDGGIGGSSFMTYAEVSPAIYSISAAISSDEMPPWPPDNTYKEYSHDRSLTSTEKTTIQDWIIGGYLEGNPANTPPAPVFNSNALLGQGDLEVQIPTYMSKAQNGNDDYVCFSVPTGLTSTRTIKAIEIIPGNIGIVHHALIYLDQNAVETTDSIGGDCSSPANTSTKLAAGYTPGATPMILPSVDPLKLGMDLNAGSKIYFAMHYPDGSYGQYDSTKVIFHFYPEGETGIRQVSASPILENWNFTLPANQVTEVNATYPASGGLTWNYSLLSVFPHMHLLGKDIKAFGILPTNDTLPLINIPSWDFHWQDFYFFKSMVKAPIGTKLKAVGHFDNTSDNHENPNDPPITTYPGLNTTDEMFLVYFHYLPYVQGDEDYDMEALMAMSLADITKDQNENLEVYPNPFSSTCTIKLKGTIGDNYSITIYDSQGKEIERLVQNDTFKTETESIEWNQENLSINPGIYTISINSNGAHSYKRVVKF
jgi:hypothetical protein